ncbi:MAG: hypothetical protein F7C35_07865 [Desulfurococcales archaeon]|nr:hypothetical protein [Desulfurococcales archaeon]
MSSGGLTGFLSWLRLRAPVSIRDYARYYERYRVELETLKISRLPCNSWVLKLAGSYIEFLLYNGSVDLETYARLRMELRLRKRACEPPNRGVGIGRCDGRVEVPEHLYWFARGLLESGTRLKHLWLIRESRPDRFGSVLVWDVNRSIGRKRVNVVILHEDTGARLAWLVDRLSYERVKDRGRRVGFSCMRKYHYNLCLAASRRDRAICDFIQGRNKPVSILHYEEYKASTASLAEKIWPGSWAMLRGASLQEAIRLVRELVDDAGSGRVEANDQSVSRTETQGPSELYRDVYAEILSILSLYSDRLH